MKLTALYDPGGVILAAVAGTGRHDDPATAASEGHEVGTFELPPSAAHLNLDEICHAFRVDIASQQLIEAKPAGQ